eukprot:TRINITY_DN11003_c1_g3_i1.p1 TRINITY_DN11003_c1_g3~~TRINITY_DN11003_c1_g3_i1.p1  ORF type:complete len:334 (-),score=42.23 TRINITY_DN11003_c1_g3_i1:221-1168(-)
MYGGYGNRRKNTGGIMSYGKEVDAGWQQATYILGAALSIFLLGYLYLYFIINGLNQKIDETTQQSNARQVEIQQIQGKLRSSEYVADRRQQNYEKQLEESRDLRTQLRQKTLDYMDLEKKHQSVASEVQTVTALLQEEQMKVKGEIARSTNLDQQVRDLNNVLLEARKQKDEAQRQLDLEISLGQQRERAARDTELRLRDDLLRCQANTAPAPGMQAAGGGVGSTLPPGTGTDPQQGVKLQQTNQGQAPQEIKITGETQQTLEKISQEVQGESSVEGRESIFVKAGDKIEGNVEGGNNVGEGQGEAASRSRKDLE